MLITQNKIADFVGSVEEIETRTVSVFDRKPKIDSTAFFRFDRAGNLLERNYRDEKNKKFRMFCRYDEKNLCRTRTFFEDDLETSRYEYVYDDDGRLTETHWFKYGETEPVIHRLKYSKDGSRVEDYPHEPFTIVGEGIDGVISFRIHPELKVSFTQGRVGHYRKSFGADEKLQIIEFFNKKKWLFGKIQVFYDIDGQPTKIWKFGDDSYSCPNSIPKWKKRLFSSLCLTERLVRGIWGGIKFTIRKEYLKAFNCLRIGGTVDEIRVSYDNFKRISKIHHFSKVSGHGCEIFSYDERGNPLERSSFWDSKVLSESENCRYDYDEFDNWIRAENVLMYELDKDESVINCRVEIYRSIKYFEDKL